MPTYNQLVRKPRVKKVRRSSTLALCGQPQRKGVCVKVFTTKPKKPNSALRRVAMVRLSGPARGTPGFGKSDRKTMTVLVSIKGERDIAPKNNKGEAIGPVIKTNLKEHDTILIRGGGAKDLPGCNFSSVPGVLSDLGAAARRQGRSRYGTDRPKAGSATAKAAPSKGK